MSATARKDVLLVVRARAEGERLVESLTQAVNDFRAASSATGADAATEKSRLQQLAGAVVALDRAYSGIAAAEDKASQAADRQRQKLAATRAELAAVKAQAENAAKAIAAAEAAVVDAKLGQSKLDQHGNFRTHDDAVARLSAAKAAVGPLDAQADKLTRSIRAQEAAIGEEISSLQVLGTAANAAEAALLGVGDASKRAAIAGAADAFDEQLRVMAAVGAAAREVGLEEGRMATRAAEIRAQLNPLAALQERYNRALKDARDLRRAGKLSADELAETERRLARDLKTATDQMERQGRGERGRPSMFGLKPYERTNLGYQVNDVFTQLASGTSLTQTLAQQGGQLLQLFPKLGSTIVAALGNPAILASAAAFVTIGLAVARLRNEMERVRTFEGVLKSMGDGARYSARELSNAADQLDRYGMSSASAMSSVQQFLRGGVAPDRIIEFGRAAQDMADVLSIDVADATRQVTEGLTGNWEAVQRLQEATGFLTQSEEEHIRALFESGRAAEARTTAFNIFSERMEQGARQARGPWSQSVRHLDDSWKSLLDRLGDTRPIQTAITALDGLATALDDISNATDGMRNVADVDRELRGLQRDLQDMEAQIRAFPDGSDSSRREAERLRGQIAALRQERARLQPQAATSTDTVDRNMEQRRTATQIAGIAFENEIAGLQREYAGAVRDTDRIRLQGEIAYRMAVRQTNSEQIAAARRRAAEDGERRQLEQGDSSELLRSAQRYAGRRENVPADRGVLMELFRSANMQVDPQITKWCAAFVNAVLASNGIRGNGSLRARDFANFGTRAENPRAGDIVVFRNHVGFLSGFDRNGNPRVVGGNQGNRVSEETFDRRQVLAYRRAPARDPNASPVTVDDQRAQQQAEFNNQLDLEIANRRRAVDQAKRLLGLSGAQLFTEERRQHVDDAVHQAQQNAEQRGLEFDAARKRSIEEIAGLEWDVAHARERATRAVDELSGERGAAIEALNAAMTRGDTAGADRMRTAVSAIDEELRGAIATAITFWRQFNTPESRTAIMGLESLRDNIGRTEQELRQAASQQPVDILTGRRDALREQIAFFRSEGNNDVAERLRQELQALDAELLIAIDHLIEFYRTSTAPDAQAMLLHWENVRNQVATTQQEFRVAAADIQQAFAGSLTSAAQQWAQAIGEGGNVLRATWDFFRGFASDFLQKMAMMVLQALALKLAMKIGFGNIASSINGVLNAAPLTAAAGTLTAAGGTLTVAGGTLTASAALWTATAAQIMVAASMLMAANAMGGGGGGGAGGGGASGMSGVTGTLGLLGDIFQSVGPGIFHSGGIAGSASRSRSVWSGVFANAVRYHSGGIAGLRPNEVPTILERGEEILTRANPRHILNAGGVNDNRIPEPNVHLKVINTIDAGDFVSKGLSSRVGERAFLNLIRSNRSAVNAALSGKV